MEIPDAWRGEGGGGVASVQNDQGPFAALFHDNRPK